MDDSGRLAPAGTVRGRHVVTTPTDRFWQALAQTARSRGAEPRFRARFRRDHDGAAPVWLSFGTGEPKVELPSETRTLFSTINEASILSAHEDATLGRRWQEAFQEARTAETLTPNAVCRLLLGPLAAPTRGVHAYNANVELLVDPADATRLVEGFEPSDDSWPSIAELVSWWEGGDPATSGAEPGTERSDAHRLGMRATRQVLEATPPEAIVVDGNHVKLAAFRLEQEPWPGEGLLGLDFDNDGPIPLGWRVECTTGGSATTLFVRCERWKGDNRYRGHIGLAVRRPTGAPIVWITVALQLSSALDGAVVPIRARCTLYDRKGTPGREARMRALSAAFARSALPKASASALHAFDVSIPSGRLSSSPETALQNLIHLALLKIPYMTQMAGDGVERNELDTPTGTIAGPTPADTRLGGLWPLPGGVRSYKSTFDAVLEWMRTQTEGGAVSEDAFLEMLRSQYDASGLVAMRGYLRLFESVDFIGRAPDDNLVLTQRARAYLPSREASELFDVLCTTYTGLLETLCVVSALQPATPEQTHKMLEQLLGVTWKTQNQSSFRRNWLLSLGLTERTPDGDKVTEAGSKTIQRHEARNIEVRIAERAGEDLSLVLEAEESNADEAEPPSPGVVEAAPHAAGVPASWDADRVDLRPEILAPFLKRLRIPSTTLEQACAALSVGKHILFVGPPGTGKTELAVALSDAARSEGYCHGGFVSTASADWTTFDTIGGYALNRDSTLSFRSGVFLCALERYQWLVIDELNRADVDRALGELMTVLGGRGCDTPYLGDNGKLVSLGPEEGRTHRTPFTFRVLATMNTWDKTSLFRLSYAVQRRFAIIHVGIPEDNVLGELITEAGATAGLDQPLDSASITRMTHMFSRKGLLAHREVGPALLLDMIRYLRRRQAAGTAMTEALALYVLPQLEGLDLDGAGRVRSLFSELLRGWAPDSSMRLLEARLQELFPGLGDA